MNIGVCGTGTIASWMSSILNQLGNENIVLYGCATAPGFDCTEFAQKFGWKHVYPDYDALMADPEVDVVYVAVPNSFHYDLCKKAIEAGKNVVCEKPFAVNEKLAQEIIDLAEEKGVFLSEALWCSFLPVRQMIRDEIASGLIGEVKEGRLVHTVNQMFLERLKSLELGGGSILDDGPYTLGCMTDFFGTEIERVDAKVRKLDTGVDADDEYTVTYKDGSKVYVHQSFDVPREVHADYGELLGSKGKVHFEPLSNPMECKFYDLEGNLLKELTIPKQIVNEGMPPVSGYEYEWVAFEKAMREGKKECDEVPHKKTLAIAKMMTEIRRQGDVVFPFE